MYLTKSDFKVARTCPRKLFYKKQGYPSINDDDAYLQLLAEGGFMIEHIAKLLYPEGRELAVNRDHAQAIADTRAALSVEQATIFEATFAADQCLARVDILRKDHNCFDVVEVKAKSYDSEENAAAITAGRRNLFWTKWETIRAEWREYLEDVTFQVLVLLRLFPAALINPYLLMPDRSKSTSIDRLHASFRIEKEGNGSAFSRYTVEFDGEAAELRREHFLTLVSVKEEVEHLLPSSLLKNTSRFPMKIFARSDQL
jgi:hypothetical protein